MALALARENINSMLEGPARARVDVEVFELQKDSQYETTDTSKSHSHINTLRKRELRVKYIRAIRVLGRSIYQYELTLFERRSVLTGKKDLRKEIPTDFVFF